MGNCSINKEIKYKRDEDLTEVNEEDRKSQRGFLKLPYFWPELSRQQAEDLLKRHASNEGTFLARYSSEYGKLALTMVVSLNKIGNAVIHLSDNSFYLEDCLKFPTLDSLIEYYEHFDLPNKSTHTFNSRLTKPIMKNRPPAPRPWEVNEISENTEDHLYYSRINQHIIDHRLRFGLSTPTMPPRNQQRLNCIFYDDNNYLVAMRAPPLPRHDFDTTVPKQVASDTAYLRMAPQGDLIRFSGSFDRDVNFPVGV